MFPLPSSTALRVICSSIMYSILSSWRGESRSPKGAAALLVQLEHVPKGIRARVGPRPLVHDIHGVVELFPAFADAFALGFGGLRGCRELEAALAGHGLVRGAEGSDLAASRVVVLGAAGRRPAAVGHLASPEVNRAVSVECSNVHVNHPCVVDRCLPPKPNTRPHRGASGWGNFLRIFSSWSDTVLDSATLESSLSAALGLVL